MKDINQAIEFQFFVETCQLVELVIKERDVVYESFTYLLNAKPLPMQQLYRKDRKKKK